MTDKMKTGSTGSTSASKKPLVTPHKSQQLGKYSNEVASKTKQEEMKPSPSRFTETVLVGKKQEEAHRFDSDEKKGCQMPNQQKEDSSLERANYPLNRSGQEDVPPKAQGQMAGEQSLLEGTSSEGTPSIPTAANEAHKADEQNDDKMAAEMEYYKSTHKIRIDVLDELQQFIKDSVANKLRSDQSTLEQQRTKNQQRLAQCAETLNQQKNLCDDVMKKQIQLLKDNLTQQKQEANRRINQEKKRVTELENRLRDSEVALKKDFDMTIELKQKELQDQNRKLISQREAELGKEILNLQELLSKRIKSEKQLSKMKQKLQGEKQQISGNLASMTDKYSQLSVQFTSLQDWSQQLETKANQLQKSKKQLQQDIRQKDQQYWNFRDQTQSKYKSLETKWKKDFNELKMHNENQIKMRESLNSSQVSQLKRQVQDLLKEKKSSQVKLSQIQTAHQQEVCQQQLKRRIDDFTNLQSICQQLNSILNNEKKTNSRISYQDLPQALSYRLISLDRTIQDRQKQFERTTKDNQQIIKEAEQIGEWLKAESNNIQLLKQVSSPLKRQKQNKLGSLWRTVEDMLGNTSSIIASYKQRQESLVRQIEGLKMQLVSKTADLDARDKTTGSLRQQKQNLTIQNTKTQIEFNETKVQLRARDLALSRLKEGFQLDLKAIQKDLVLRSAEVASLKSELVQARQWKTAFDGVTSSKEKLEQEIKGLHDEVQSFKMKAALLGEQLKTQKEEAAKSIDQTNRESSMKSKSLESEFSQKERVLKENFDSEMRKHAQKLNQALQQTIGSSPSDLNFDSIASFIKQKISNSGGAFQVSEILEHLPNERSYLQSECCSFLECSNVSSKLVYKYDQNNKNFQVYLPSSTQQFPFLILFKTNKTQTVFGVVASSLGRDGKGTALNLTGKRVMKRNERSRVGSCIFDNNTLKFGNDEITVKNNSVPEVRVNTTIIGEKYFMFNREDLIGKGESSPVLLEGFQIHKIYKV